MSSLGKPRKSINARSSKVTRWYTNNRPDTTDVASTNYNALPQTRNKLQINEEIFGPTIRTQKLVRDTKHADNDKPSLDCSNQDVDEELEKQVENFGQRLKSKRQTSLSVRSRKQRDSESEDSTGDISDSFYISYEDIFGLYNFEADDEDNYVIEAYHREDVCELFRVDMTISRHPIIEHKFEHPNSVIDNQQYNSNSSLELSETNSRRVQETASASSPFLQNKYFGPGVGPKNQLHGEEDDFDNNSLNNYLNGRLAPEFSETRLESPGTSVENDEVDNSDYFAVINAIPDESIKGETNKHSVNQFENNKHVKDKEKIDYIIDEMIETERKYIEGLRIVVEKYKPYIERNTPVNLMGRTPYLFSNIEEIYTNATKFLKSMEACSKTVDSMTKIFIDSASEFELYPMYSKNKPTADDYLKQFGEIIKVREQELNDKLGLASYLLSPIQRLGKYILLLQNIEKDLNRSLTKLKKEKKGPVCDQLASKKAEETLKANLKVLTTAIDMIQTVMRRGNDYIAIDSIKNSKPDLTTKGSFMMRAQFNIIKPKRYSSMVFLFENILVFTDKSPIMMEQFVYLDSIAMSDLSLGRCEDKPNIFTVSKYTKAKGQNQNATYTLEAESQKAKAEWVQAIETKLWTQLQKAKEQQKITSVSNGERQVKVDTKNTIRGILKKRIHKNATFYYPEPNS